MIKAENSPQIPKNPRNREILADMANRNQTKNGVINNLAKPPVSKPSPTFSRNFWVLSLFRTGFSLN